MSFQSFNVIPLSENRLLEDATIPVASILNNWASGCYYYKE